MTYKNCKRLLEIGEKICYLLIEKTGLMVGATGPVFYLKAKRPFLLGKAEYITTSNSIS